MARRSSRRGKKGISLIELSIVVLIIGLITTGVLAGQHLIRVAELRAVISEVERYRTAINNFEQIYQSVPGDMFNATTFWTAATDGNGNGRVEVAEDTDVWQQLSLSGLIGGGFTGAAGLTLGTTVPESKINGGAYWMIYRGTGGEGTTLYNRAGNHIVLGTINGGGTTTNDAAISAEDAYYIDRTMDDGNPAQGSTVAVEENYGTSATICADAAAPLTDLTADYVLDQTNSTRPTCIMAFWLE